LVTPNRAPLIVVDVTEVNPANVVLVPPRLIVVEPIVTLPAGELGDPVIAEYGMLVNNDASPANLVAVKVPVLGTKLNFELDVLNATLPEVADDKVG